MTLNEGDRISVTKDTLANTEAGLYWVDYISYCHGYSYYGLRKFYGRKIAGRFFTQTIDALMAQGKLITA